MPDGMFIDEAEIRVRSGKGGDGMVHFRREKYVPRGGPDGGDGGRGGDVILVAKATLNTLSTFRYTKQFQAKDGGDGGANNRTGRSAEALILHVPLGTLVYDKESGDLLGDLVEEGQQLVVCRGGRGGKGNARFATSVKQAPRIAEKGEPGEERLLHLELRLIADVGIVGVPNAGKSTFLASVTRAKPKIAPYPFTTLVPNLGIAELDENTTLVLADIPGLIEGAHQGAGLGHDFLRHIQRTRVLIHVLDGLSSDPLIDLAQINSELALFDPHLAEKPQVVALNKIDLPEVRQRWSLIAANLERRSYSAFAISALTGEGVREVLYRAKQLLDTATPISTMAERAALEMPVYRLESDPRQFKIEAAPGGWRVIGKDIERAAAMTYWEYDDSIRRFQKILKALGVEQALREVGVREGDTVYIGDYELEWVD